jgi:hypothetical protein
MNDHFECLVDGVSIEAIDAVPVPDPPHVQSPGIHLFVNCFYSSTTAEKVPVELLSTARSDLTRIVKIVIRDDLLNGMESLCVSFMGACVHGGKRQRIYRYAMHRDSYPKDADAVSISWLLGADRHFQSSDVGSVAHLF